MGVVAHAKLTRQEVRVILENEFCGCGNPELATAALLQMLRLHPLYDHRAEFDEWVPDDGVQYLLMYQLDRMELTEHGGSVGGAWLTDKGKALLAALEREEADNFEALSESCCIHGYSFDADFTTEAQSHDCMNSTEPSSPDHVWEKLGLTR